MDHRYQTSFLNIDGSCDYFSNNLFNLENINILLNIESLGGVFVC